jgi:hypothetical protein
MYSRYSAFESLQMPESHNHLIPFRTRALLAGLRSCFNPVSLPPLDEHLLNILFEAKIDTTYFRQQAPLHPRQRLYEKIWREQRRQLVLVLRAFQDEGCRALVYKSSEYNPSLLQDRPINVSCDADVLVPGEDIQLSKKILLDAGFRQAHLLNDGSLREMSHQEIGANEADSYEICPFRKLATLDLDQEEARASRQLPIDFLLADAQQTKILIEIDVHERVAADIEPGLLFGGTRSSALGVGETFSWENHLWLTSAKFYSEVALHGKRSLRELVFLGMISNSIPIDWNRLCATAADLELRPALYYPLNFLREIIGVPVPAEVMIELSPAKGSRDRDWGHLLGPLLGFVEPLPLGIAPSD